MSTEIKRILTGNEWDGIRNANSSSAANPFATIADLTSGVSGGNLLISGSAAWSGTDLDFDVTALEYLIAGVTYNTAPTTVTLADGDPTNPRFDAIVADDTGTVSVITGTPSVTPLTPSIGENQVLVQYVLVGTGATTPTITTEYIYREGSPLTDWNPGTSCISADCPTADFASNTPAPFQGPQCTLIDFSTYSTGRYIKYDAPAPVVRSDYAVLTFRVWLFDDLTTIDSGLGRSPFVRLYANSGTTWLGTVYLDAWGLQRNVTNTWQLVSIPIAAFTGNTGVNQIDQFRIHCVESVANPAPVTQIAIDDVKLQSGYGPSVPSTQTFDVQDDGVTIAATTKINFVDTPTATVLVTDDTLNDRVNVEITIPGGGALNTYNVSSTQWSKTLAAPVSLLDGNIANGFTFFTNADKVAGGSTAYDEYSIAYGLSIILSGSLGSANINLDGIDYLATFNTSLYQTAVDFVTTHEAALNLNNIRVFALGSGADGRLRFCAPQLILDAMTITPTIIQVANLDGTIANEFIGTTNSAPDHLLVPYAGKPYFGKRILHTIRANFNITSGSVQYAELGLFRYQNDTQIGSAISIQRNPDTTGSLVVIETYTSDALDPFVIGGFYLALVNNTGQTLNFFGPAGVLIQNIFDSETSF